MKKAAARLALVTALIGSCALVGTPAKAVTWDFLNPHPPNPAPGTLGSSQTFFDTTNSYAITAYGISNATYLPVNVAEPTTPTAFTVTTSTIPTATNLYLKNGGACPGTCEDGLGIANATDHEITQGNMIEIKTSTHVGNYQFEMASTTSKEGWDVYGSNSNAAAGAAVLTLLYSDGQDQGPTLHSLSGYTYYYFTYDGAVVDSGQGDNVLLNKFVGTALGNGNDSPTPLPAALPLFAGGLGVMGLLARRRKRKNASTLAAA